MLPEFHSPKPVNKTRSMVPSESESPLLSISQPHFFPHSHSLLLQLPLFSCPCCCFFYPVLISTPLHSHISKRPDYFSTLSLTHSVSSIYLLMLGLWLRFLGAADNSGVLPFTYSPHVPYMQPKHDHHFWPHWHPRETDQLLINAIKVK